MFKYSAINAVVLDVLHKQVIKGLPEHLKIVDLSADFRLRSTASYAEW